MEHFDGARLSPNSVRNAVWHALKKPVCQYLRTRNPRCSTVYIDNSLGPLARDSLCSMKFVTNIHAISGPGSSVGIATGYGLDSPVMESRWGARFSAPVQTGPGAYPASCTMDTGSYPGVKSGRGVTLTSHPLLVLRSRKSRAIPLLPLRAVRPVQSLSACTVELYLYSPYGPYGLYRASVPVKYSYTCTPPMGRTACTEPQYLYSRAIPVLPLWTVRPVQNLSACTVELYLYSPYGPYGLYRASMPVQ